jgi:hypothetical protein
VRIDQNKAIELSKYLIEEVHINYEQEIKQRICSHRLQRIGWICIWQKKVNKEKREN